MPVPETRQKIVNAISSWDRVSINPHRFGGVEFRLGKRELGHLHGDYQADIPFPKSVRDQLVSEKKAEPHHILPNSGWITFRFVNAADIEKGLDLFRLSYSLACKSEQRITEVQSKN